MAGHGSQATATSANSRPSPAVNSHNPALNYINGHGNLPDTPASTAAPAAPAAKKGKSKKATDPNETGKLLAQKISQLEQDAAGEKDQEAEIGGYSSRYASKETVLASMRKHDLPQDVIAEVAKAFDEGARVSMVEKGLPSLETMESLLANFSLTSPALDLPRIYETLFSRPLPMNAMDQQKLTEMPPGLFADIEREVKKATRDLSNLLAGLENPLSKIEAVQKKYADLLADMKRMDRENLKNKKKSELLQKEKDQGRSELSKTNSMKEKLEKLCRELQRENKKLKDEQKKMEDSERRSREDFSERAETLYREINDTMNHTEGPESQKSNVDMDELFRQKFKSFIDQYDLRELHFASLLRTRECEFQLEKARNEDHRKRADAEAAKAKQLTTQVEDTLNNSNDLFLTFRKEMEEMSKKTKRLEKENLSLTRKHDLTNRNILEMAEERTKVNKEIETLRKKNNTLESIVRRMQEQGRAPAGTGALEGDEEGTESEYDEEYDDEEGSEEGDYDDDTEEEALQAHVGALPTFGPVPPPPPSSQAQVNGNKVNGEVNGVKTIAV